MTPTITVMLIVFGTAALAGLATWGLCALADDPPHHCAGCTCGQGHVRLIPPPTQLYNYEQDPTYHTAS